MKTFWMVVMFPINLVSVIISLIISPLTIGLTYFEMGEKWSEGGVTLKQILDIHFKSAVKALRNEL